MRGGGGGEGRANKRNGSEHRVAGSADGNSDLLRVTRRKLSCGTIGEGHSFAPVILTYYNVFLVYSAERFVSAESFRPPE